MSDMMLVAQNGAVCYVDYENYGGAAYWVRLYDMRYDGRLPHRSGSSLRVAYVVDGVVKARGKVPQRRLMPNEYVIATSFHDWLDEHASVGQTIKIVPAHPFRPNTYRHKLHVTNRPLAKGNTVGAYTPKYGRQTPKTLFRHELVVSKGRVVQRGGGSSRIPKDGFVIAAHGSPIGFTSTWGMIGAKVELSDDSLTITIDDEAWFLNAEYYLHTVRQQLANSRKPASFIANTRIAIKRLKDRLALARKTLPDNRQESWKLVQNTIKEAKQLLYASCNSPKGEARVVLTPWPMTGRRLLQHIDRLKGAGIDTDIVCWTKGKDEETKEMFRTLQLHGIRPVLWTNLPMNCRFKPLQEQLSAHPDWADYNIHGKQTRRKAPDPANPEAMAWWCKQVEEKCRDLDMYGILFDYEGYYGGYSELSIKKFIAKEKLDSSFDPRKIKNKKSVLARKWYNWRRQLIVNATHQLAQACRRGRPGIKVINCVVAPNYSAKYYADEGMRMIWKDWVDMGTFDITTAMVYSQDAQWVIDSCKKSLKMINGRTPFWPLIILYPETGGGVTIEPELLVKQVEGVRNAGVKDGIGLFMSVQFMSYRGWRGNDIYDCLRYGLFRSTATQR